MPAPPIPESTSRVKATSRAFSFGRKKAEALSNASRPGLQQSQSDNASQQNGRGRSMTDTSFASGSTATPPRLLDAGLDLGQTDHDGFGSMFENFGKSSSQTDLGKSLTGLSLSDVQVKCFFHSKCAKDADICSLDRLLRLHECRCRMSRRG